MSVLRYAAVFIAAFVGGVVGFLPVYVMGLVVPLLVVGPLALLAASVMATLLACWIANFMAPDGSRSRLLGVFGASVIAIVLAIFLYFAGAWAVNVFRLGFEIWVTLLVYLPAAFAFAGVITAVAWRTRSPGGRLGWPGGVMLLAAVGILSLAISTSYSVGFFFVSEGTMVLAGVFLAILSLLVAIWVSRRHSRDLLGDAGITLCLSAALPPVIYGVTYVSCSYLTYCGA